MEKNLAANADDPVAQAQGRVLAVTLPGIVTLVLGGTYVAGAITTLGQLLDAGFNPIAVFSLIPIEQHLGRGLQVVLSPTFFLVAFFSTIQLLAAPAFSTPRTTGEHEAARATRKAALRVLLPVYLLVLLLFAPWPEIVQVTLALAVALLLDYMLYGNPPVLATTYRTRVLLLVSFAWLTLAIGNAFINTTPFPQVVVETKQGEVRGALLARTDTFWYVGRDGERVTAVQVDDAENPRITPKDKPVMDSVPELIF